MTERILYCVFSRFLLPPFCDNAHTRSHSSVHILSGRANNYSLSDTFGSTIIPLGKRTTKHIRWIGPSLVSEKTEKPMWDCPWGWPCSKFLALHCINLYAVENHHPVHRNYA